MRWRRRHISLSASRCVFPSLFSQHLANGPTTWMNRPHANVRCCCLGQLFSRPQYAKDVRHSVSCKPSRADQPRDWAIVINPFFFVMTNLNFTRKCRRNSLPYSARKIFACYLLRNFCYWWLIKRKSGE